jgi:hypothetical protein
MVSGMAAQFTGTKGAPVRGERSWRRRAASSLPVPLSPRRSTVAEAGATCRSVSRAARKVGALPTSPPSAASPENRARRARSARFSATSEARSSACRTDFTMAWRFTGLVMKS